MKPYLDGKRVTTSYMEGLRNHLQHEMPSFPFLFSAVDPLNAIESMTPCK